MSTSPRREFLGQLATAAVALAGTACAAPAIATQQQAAGPVPSAPPTPSTPPAKVVFDDTWTTRLTGKHKAVFDSPEIEEGTALYHAMSYLGAIKDVFGTGDSDASVVVVLRHAAVPMLYNDVMWAKYDLGAQTKTLDQKSKQPVTRNIYYQRLDKDGKPSSEEKPSATIKSLTNRGVIFIGCDLATRGFSYRIAAKTKQAQSAVYEEIRQNLVPGAILMPTGVFGMLLAQEAGCSVMRAT